jgi:hypothetical protein
MRLIDADELIKTLGKSVANNGNVIQISVMEVKTIIKEQPTAYDVDKVISQIENKIFSAELYGDEWDGQTVNNLLCFGDVYEIVKGAVKDE